MKKEKQYDSKLFDIFKRFAKTHLVMAEDMDGNPIFCNYLAYVEVTKKETTYPLVSEKEFNQIIEELKNEIHKN